MLASGALTSAACGKPCPLTELALEPAILESELQP